MAEFKEYRSLVLRTLPGLKKLDESLVEEDERDDALLRLTPTLEELEAVNVKYYPNSISGSGSSRPGVETSSGDEDITIITLFLKRVKSGKWKGLALLQNAN